MGDQNKQRYVGVVSQPGLITDPHHNVLGYVSENGFIYDSHHHLLGYVSQQGVIRDVHLQGVGQVNVEQESFPFGAGRAAFSVLIQAKEEEMIRCEN